MANREEIEERNSIFPCRNRLGHGAVRCGDVAFIEAARMPGGKGFQFQGQLGDVMAESAPRPIQLHSLVKADDFGIDPDFFFEKKRHPYPWYQQVLCRKMGHPQV